MKKIHYFAIGCGIATFAALVNWLDASSSNKMVALCALGSLHVGWLIASPSTVVGCYSATAKGLFGRDVNGEVAAGITTILFVVFWIVSPFLFAYGHYHAITDFWVNAGWNVELNRILSEADISFFSESELSSGPLLLATFTFTMLICACWSFISVILESTSREKVVLTAKMFAGIVVLIGFNHLVVMALFVITAVLLCIFCAAVIAFLAVVFIRIAGKAHMASVTVGIIIGDAVCLSMMNESTVVMAIAVGSISGFAAGEIVHHLGRYFLRNQIGEDIFV